MVKLPQKINRYYLLLYFCFSILILTIIINYPTDWWDTWFHLKIGETIVRSGHILATDIFSYTALGRPYFSHEWLSQVVLFFTHDSLGIRGLKILVYLLAGSVIVVLYRFLRFKKVDSILALIYLSIFTILTSPFWQPRPQIFGFFLLTVLLICLKKYYYNPIKLVLTVPILSLIWANFHGTAIIIPPLCIYYCFINATPIKQLKQLKLTPLFLPIIAFLFTLITPSTIRLYTYMFENNIYALSKNVAEFRPILTYILEIVPILFIIFIAIILIISIHALLLKNSNTRAGKLATIASVLVLFLPFYSYRILPLSLIIFTILSAPEVLLKIQEITAKIILFKTGKILVTVAVIFLTLFFSIKFPPTLTLKQPNMSLFPVDAASFIEKEKIVGNIYNPYDWGGFLLWRLGPDFKVFVDGRMDVYAQTEVPQRLNELFELLNNKNSGRDTVEASWNTLLDTFSIDHVILHTTQDRTLGELTIQKQGWSLIYFDSVASILTRSESFKTYANNLSAIDPFSISPYKPGRMDDALGQYELYASENPGNTLAQILYAILLLEKGDYSIAEKVLNTVVDREPDNAAAYYNLGLVYIGKKDYQSALMNFEKTMRADSSYAAAYKNAAKISVEMIPNRQKAIRYYRRYINLNPDDPERDTIYKILHELES